MSRFQSIASCCCVALGSSLTSLHLHFLISEQTREATLYCTWLLREHGRFAEGSPPAPHPIPPPCVEWGKDGLSWALPHPTGPQDQVQGQ